MNGSFYLIWGGLVPLRQLREMKFISPLDCLSFMSLSQHASCCPGEDPSLQRERQLKVMRDEAIKLFYKLSFHTVGALASSNEDFGFFPS